MDSAARPGMDLEKELTCSICTEILYQPLTLLDCLHTFCGSCLKDWFSWQLAAAETSPTPPPAGSHIYTCPSCRASVRDTRHNAAFTTLLDMLLAAKPDKAKTEEEKNEMREKYVPGDNVLPPYQGPDNSPEERRAQEMERRMIEQAREISLRDVGVGDQSSRNSSSHRRATTHSDREGSRHRDVRDRGRRQEERRRRAESDNGLLSPEALSEDHDRRHNESRQNVRESSGTRRRHIEHQASIRSLISSSDVDDRNVEREIEDFARQIEEEGLLDGLDLDNLDLTQNDELSRKITEAYRRRQGERSRHEPTRRSNASAASHRSEIVQSSASQRPPLTDTSRSGSRQRSSSASARPSGPGGHMDDRSRPPLSSTHLEVRADPERRRRRRNSSGTRSNTDPVRPRTAETRPAARSQTDLTATGAENAISRRSQSTEPPSSSSGSSQQQFRRPSLADSRSTSMPSSNLSDPAANRDMSFSARAGLQNAPLPAPDLDTANRQTRAAQRSSGVGALNPLPSLGLMQSSSQAPSQHKRNRSQYYQEPSISCSRCSRQHIEYELHYNCSKCADGNWNLCLDCYRAGKGCKKWYGFGYAAFKRWDRAQAATEEALERPHILAAHRYKPPRHTPGGAEGRRTLTTDNPERRLETGKFCSRCAAWTNAIYWRCDFCNEGDWGFCNSCVNQGHGCTHPLLPLHQVSSQEGGSRTPSRSNDATPPGTPPLSPQGPLPSSATLLTGPNSVGTTDQGDFRPLTFSTSCDICLNRIPPAESRYHCFACTSAAIRSIGIAEPGDYDICFACYGDLEHKEKAISEENGENGWRRCLKGHRMVVIEFDSDGRRVTTRDLVGGRDLSVQDCPDAENATDSGLQKWRWKDAEQPTHRIERLVTQDVAATTPAPLRTGVMVASAAAAAYVADDDVSGSGSANVFPPDGGTGLIGVATWSWYPKPGAEDELLFPRGAEITEIEDMNGDWLVGSYMGIVGLVPAPYVWLS